MFPRKKQAPVRAREYGVIDERYCVVNGRNGAWMKGGIGRTKATADRTNRFIAIGSHSVGTTNHLVRVKTCKKT